MGNPIDISTARLMDSTSLTTHICNPHYTNEGRFIIEHVCNAVGDVIYISSD